MRERDEADLDYAPFTKAYGLVLTDSRLSSDDKVLLLWLRFRAGAVHACTAGFKSIAEDLGWKVRKLYRTLQHLYDLGMVRSESRGYSRTSLKEPVPETEIYGKESLYDVYRLLRHDRTEDDLSMLQSRHLSPEMSSSVTSDTPVVSSMTPHNCHQRHSSSVTDGSAEVDTRSRSRKADQDPNVADPSISPRKLKILDGGLARRRGIDNQVEVEKDERVMAETSDQAEERVRKAREAMERARVSSHAAAVKTEQKKAARQARREMSPEDAKQARREARKEELGPDHRATALDVQRWFEESWRAYFAAFPWERFDLRELGLARRMLDAYGDSLTERTIQYVLSHWVDYQKKYSSSKVGPVPTMSWVYGWRKTVTVEAAAALPIRKPDEEEGEVNFATVV